MGAEYLDEMEEDWEAISKVSVEERAKILSIHDKHWVAKIASMHMQEKRVGP